MTFLWKFKEARKIIWELIFDVINDEIEWDMVQEFHLGTFVLLGMMTWTNDVGSIGQPILLYLVLPTHESR